LTPRDGEPELNFKLFEKNLFIFSLLTGRERQNTIPSRHYFVPVIDLSLYIKERIIMEKVADRRHIIGLIFLHRKKQLFPGAVRLSLSLMVIFGIAEGGR
jgi:hypothetical protein